MWWQRDLASGSESDGPRMILVIQQLFSGSSWECQGPGAVESGAGCFPGLSALQNEYDERKNSLALQPGPRPHPAWGRPSPTQVLKLPPAHFPSPSRLPRNPWLPIIWPQRSLKHFSLWTFSANCGDMRKGGNRSREVSRDPGSRWEASLGPSTAQGDSCPPSFLLISVTPTPPSLDVGPSCPDRRTCCPPLLPKDTFLLFTYLLGKGKSLCWFLFLLG